MSRGCRRAACALPPGSWPSCPPTPHAGVRHPARWPSPASSVPKLYDDVKSRFFPPFSLFLPAPLQVTLSLPSPFLSPPPVSPFSINPTLISSSSPSISPALSPCGRVVINPCFIAGEFLSHCRADSSPRSKTLLGPNPILPPSIFPSLPPSGPDYRDSRGVAGLAGLGEWRGGITPLDP